VVLPLLEERVVEPGWIDEDRFLAGYGAAQAVPGPLFTFAAYLGAAFDEPPNGAAGGLLALGAIFLPSFLLVFGVLPWWARLRAVPRMTSALAGANAAVVGLLAAALITPLGTSAVHGPADLVLAAAAFVLLAVGRLPPWLVVIAGALAGIGVQAAGIG
jgi:chromate transporter